MKQYLTPLLFFFLMLVSLWSCSNDDGEIEEDAIGAPPSAFTLSVNAIEIDAAVLDWSQAHTGAGQDIKYDVTVNDSLLASDITEKTFTLDSLHHSTDYSISVRAYNDIGEKTSEVSFTTLTPDGIVYLLKRFDNNRVDGPGPYKNYGFVINYFYDEAFNFLATYEGQEYNSSTLYKRGYDSFCDCLKVRTTDFSDYGVDTYFYRNGATYDSIILDRSYPAFEYIQRIEQKFLSENSYEEKHFDIEMHIPKPLDEHFLYSFVRNNQGHVVEITRKNLFNNDEDFMSLEYSNGNLVKVVNYAGTVFEIEYDENPSFQTYPADWGCYTFRSDYRHSSFNNQMHFLNFEIGEFPGDISRIPYFNDYPPTNNPVLFKRNGSVTKTIQYEYNMAGYPIKMYTDNNTEHFSSFEYYEIY